MNTDKLGVTFNIGDTVVYATASERSCGLGTGIITDVVTFQPSVQVKIKTSISGKIIHRDYCNIISIEPIKEHCPEYFI